jgi:hypothetical protein
MILRIGVGIRASMTPPRARKPKPIDMHAEFPVHVAEVSVDDAPLMMRVANPVGAKDMIDVRFFAGRLYSPLASDTTEEDTLRERVRRMTDGLTRSLDTNWKLSPTIPGAPGVPIDPDRIVWSQREAVGAWLQQQVDDDLLLVGGVIHGRVLSPVVGRVFEQGEPIVERDGERFGSRWFEPSSWQAPTRIGDLPVQIVEVVDADLFERCRADFLAYTALDAIVDEVVDEVVGFVDEMNDDDVPLDEPGVADEIFSRAVQGIVAGEVERDPQATLGRLESEALEFAMPTRLETAEPGEVLCPYAGTGETWSLRLNYYDVENHEGMHTWKKDAGMDSREIDVRASVVRANGWDHVASLDAGATRIFSYEDDFLFETSAPSRRRLTWEENAKYLQLDAARSAAFQSRDSWDVFGGSVFRMPIDPNVDDDHKRKTLTAYAQHRMVVVDGRLFHRCPEPMISVRTDSRKIMVGTDVSFRTREMPTADVSSMFVPLLFPLDAWEEACDVAAAASVAQGGTRVVVTDAPKVLKPDHLSAYNAAWNLRCCMARIISDTDSRSVMFPYEAAIAAVRIGRHIATWGRSSSSVDDADHRRRFASDAKIFLDAIEDPLFARIGASWERQLARKNLETVLLRLGIQDPVMEEDEVLYGFSF